MRNLYRFRRELVYCLLAWTMMAFFIVYLDPSVLLLWTFFGLTVVGPAWHHPGHLGKGLVHRLHADFHLPRWTIWTLLLTAFWPALLPYDPRPGR